MRLNYIWTDLDKQEQKPVALAPLLRYAHSWRGSKLGLGSAVGPPSVGVVPGRIGDVKENEVGAGRPVTRE
jgi:hypothetical protein